MRQGRAKGEEGPGCEDGDDVESAKRVETASSRWTTGKGVVWRQGSRQKQGPPRSPEERNPYTVQHFTASSFTGHSAST